MSFKSFKNHKNLMLIWGWVKSTNPAVNKAAAKSNTTEFIGSHKHLNYVFIVLHSYVPLCSNQRFLVLGNTVYKDTSA